MHACNKYNYFYAKECNKTKPIAYTLWDSIAVILHYSRFKVITGNPLYKILGSLVCQKIFFIIGSTKQVTLIVYHQSLLYFYTRRFFKQAVNKVCRVYSLYAQDRF